jgi:hypothetical protein
MTPIQGELDTVVKRIPLCILLDDLWRGFLSVFDVGVLYCSHLNCDPVVSCVWTVTKLCGKERLHIFVFRNVFSDKIFKSRQLKRKSTDSGAASTLIPTISQFTSSEPPWYVPNMVLPQDLQITSVKEEIHRFCTQYRARLYTHPNLTVRINRCTMVSAEYGPPTRSSNHVR